MNGKEQFFAHLKDIKFAIANIDIVYYFLTFDNGNILIWQTSHHFMQTASSFGNSNEIFHFPKIVAIAFHCPPYF